MGYLCVLSLVVMLFCEKRCLGHCLIKEFRNCIFKGTAFHRLVLEVCFFCFFLGGGGGGRELH